MIGLTYNEVKRLSPCGEQFKSAASKLGATWHERPVTVPEALKAGVPVDDVLWVLQETERDPDTERRYLLALADFAAHVLHISERYAPKDSRPRNFIIAARALARGEIEAARAARGAALAVGGAWSVEGAWAAESAWAAEGIWAAEGAWAASAADAAVAEEQAEKRAAERDWQADRLAAWFSDPEPEDWPLPPKPEEMQ